MPWVRIDLLEGRSEEQKQKVAAEITRTIAAHLDCKPASVSIVFNDVSPTNWATEGRLISVKASEKRVDGA